jgi:hypothetical protein
VAAKALQVNGHLGQRRVQVKALNAARRALAALANDQRRPAVARRQAAGHQSQDPRVPAGVVHHQRGIVLQILLGHLLQGLLHGVALHAAAL